LARLELRAFFTLTAVACLTSLPALGAEDRWQQYTYSDAGFSANFPDQPRSFLRLDPSSQVPWGSISEQVYSFEEGGVVYSVGISDFRHLGANPDVAVTEAVSSLVGEGKLDSKIALEIDQVQGTEYIAVGADGTRYTDGIFFFKEQLYQVKVVYPVSNRDPAGSSGVGFFMAHFRFLDPY
jgi:hypothetical protein